MNKKEVLNEIEKELEKRNIILFNNIILIIALLVSNILGFLIIFRNNLFYDSFEIVISSYFLGLFNIVIFIFHHIFIREEK